jgi:hypothetical protein
MLICKAYDICNHVLKQCKTLMNHPIYHSDIVYVRNISERCTGKWRTKMAAFMDPHWRSAAGEFVIWTHNQWNFNLRKYICYIRLYVMCEIVPKSSWLLDFKNKCNVSEVIYYLLPWLQQELRDGVATDEARCVSESTLRRLILKLHCKSIAPGNYCVP